MLFVSRGISHWFNLRRHPVGCGSKMWAEPEQFAEYCVAPSQMAAAAGRSGSGLLALLTPERTPRTIPEANPATLS